MGDFVITALCVFGAVFLCFFYSTKKWAASKRLPPGPPLKLFGGRKAGSNLPPWKSFTALQKQFGALVGSQLILVGLTHFTRSSFVNLSRIHSNHWYSAERMDFILGADFLVLGTMKAANELLDKRDSIYSSRPRSIMALVRPFQRYCLRTH